MEKFSMDEEILTIREVAELLKLHPKTINKFAISGKLPAYRIGRQWRFRKSEVLKALEKREAYGLTIANLLLERKHMHFHIIRIPQWFALCSLFLALSFPAGGQQPKKVPRIGYLVGGDLTSESTRAEAIRLALRGLGYIEGQNIATEYRYAEGKLDRFSELAAELVCLKVDIID
jgi:excisionase family DNA binding protein